MAVGAYFLGCFNGAVIVSKYILRDDVRNHGSGNAGLTNFYRTFGGVLTFVVILTDVLKAVLAVLLGVWLLSFIGPTFGKYWAGLFCLLGHMFPCMFHFKGGKGILSGGTIAIMIGWEVALVGLGRIFDPQHLDPVCVPGLLLGRGQLSLRHLVCLPQRGADSAGGGDRRPDPLETPGEHGPPGPGQGEQVFLPQEEKTVKREAREMEITVLGSGGWGTALSVLLLAHGHRVTLWSFHQAEAETLRRERENPLLKGVALPEELAVANDFASVPGSDLVVFATPSFAVRQTAGTWRPTLGGMRCSSPSPRGSRRKPAFA